MKKIELITVISPTKQSFLGETFYLCGAYFQHKGKRLHRAVWEYHNGPIPAGFHVHHIDGNRANNNIENLALIQGERHLHLHMTQPHRTTKSKSDIEIARKAANEWHGSKEGIAFHSILGKENWKKRTTQTYHCSFCGKEFQTKHIYGENQNHFCGNNCRAKYGRIHRRNLSSTGEE